MWSGEMSSASSEGQGARKRLEFLLQHCSLGDRIDASGELADQLREDAAALRFWFARRDDPELPTLTLLFGCSGVGKSTIFNALAGADHAFVSSVERPATRGAIVAGAPSVIERLRREDLFPTFECVDAKETEPSPARGREGRLLRLETAGAGAARGLIIDCPDFDTRVDANRHIAARLLSWADRVVFVTSTERYADRSALPYLERVGRARLDALFVLNMVESETDDLVGDYQGMLVRIPGLADARPLGLPRTEARSLASTREFQELRRQLEAPVELERGRERLAEFCRRFRRDLLLPLQEQRRAFDETIRRLDKVGRGKTLLEMPGDLERLREFEAETKPLLKLGPRPAWKLLRTMVQRPKSSDVASVEAPGEEREEIEEPLLDQIWFAIEAFQIDTRTALDGTAHRQVLNDESLREVEFSREDLRRDLAPIVNELHEFSRTTRKRLHERQGGEHSLKEKIRREFLDRTLALLGVLLTVLVIPAVLHETLARLGMKDFVNQIETIIAQSRTRMRALVEEKIEEQRNRYRAKLESSATSESLLEELAVALEEPRS
jgi:hypothetical protein